MPLLPSDRRQVAARVALFLLLLGVGGWPWQAVRRAFSSAYCATVGAALAHMSFNDGAGHARVFPAPPTSVRRPGDNVTADAVIELSIDGQPGRPRLGINLRRDAYLPLLILVVAIAVAPLRLRSKGICLLVGVPIVLAGSLVALAALVSWVFAGGMGPPEAMKSHTLDLMVRMLIEPPSTRFIVPIVVAAGLVGWRWRRDRPPAEGTSDARVV